ncbi:type II secretion system F family protein [Oceanobacter antarcticus]|uniref:Type II secretion system F family protein n=1 Tax=Oceanobacter antarcticus TaxID=3133425 RepID=A0ABW8NG49_9GAMM
MMDVNLIDGLLFGLLMMLLLGSVVIWGIPFQSRTKPDIDHSLTYTNTWLAPRQLVLQAGFSPDSVALWFLPASLMLIPMTFLLAISEFHLAWPIALGAGLLMACLPLIVLLLLRGRRLAEVRQRLPFFIDMLAAYLSAGVSLPVALKTSIDVCHRRDDVLVLELGLVMREIELGVAQEEAFDALKFRLPCHEIERLAALIQMGSRMGVPLCESLRAFAEAMSTRQQQWVRKLIARRSLVSLFPMLLVAFPVFGVLVVFPAVHKIYGLFQELGLSL